MGKLYYNPKVETSFKRQYKITVDIWNYNKWWQDTVFCCIMSSSMFYVLGYRSTKYRID